MAEDKAQTEMIARALDAMWARFLPDIRERIDVLDAAAAASGAGALTEELRASAQAAAHKLAGTLGTFGLQRGTEVAQELEIAYASNGIGPEQASALAQSAREIRTIANGRH